MKKCPVCGSANFDMSTVCERCQHPLGEEIPVVIPNKGLKIAAKIFLLIGMFGYWAIFLSAFLCWTISLFLSSPEFTIASLGAMVLYLGFAVLATFMTKSYIRKSASGLRVGIGFKVCTMLLVNWIAGILMLCDVE